MSTTATLLEKTLCTGAAASVATAVTTALFGVAETGKAVAPINAVSHIAWGDEAATHDEVSMKYSGLGLALNTVAVTGWSAIYELLHDRRSRQKDLGGMLIDGAIVSALAYVTDYYLVPKRFTPGFEMRLSNCALMGIYSVLALSFAAGSWAHE